MGPKMYAHKVGTRGQIVTRGCDRNFSPDIHILIPRTWEAYLIRQKRLCRCDEVKGCNHQGSHEGETGGSESEEM